MHSLYRTGTDRPVHQGGLCAGLYVLHVLKRRHKHVQGQTSLSGAVTAFEMLDSPRTVPGWAVVSQDFAEAQATLLGRGDAS